MKEPDGLKDCKLRFKKLKERYVTALFTRTAQELITDAWMNREFAGFTGNTQTSYSCGVYIYGKLCYVVSAGDRAKKPVGKKVEKGKKVFLERPYEEKPRKVTGQVDVDGKYGQQTAEAFLRRYKGIPPKGFGLVMTTGTEYSVYLEEERDLNVLSVTKRNAKGILAKNVKPITQ